MIKFNWEKFKKEKIAVELLNKEECVNFLMECEKRGLKWSLHEAMEFIPDCPTSITCNFWGVGDNDLGHSDTEFHVSQGYQIVKWCDVKNSNSTEEIIIYKNGSEVSALHKENGKTVKSAKAICSPEDKFDFNVGAKLAFNKLVGGDIKEESDFKKGDFVKVIGDFHNHYFPSGSTVRIENCENDNYIVCYGLTVRNGKRFFGNQWVDRDSIEKIEQ